MSFPLQEKEGRGEDEMLSLGMEISLLDWKERVVICVRVDQRKWDRWKVGVLGSVEVDGDEGLEGRRSRAAVVRRVGNKGEGRDVRRVMVKVFVE